MGQYYLPCNISKKEFIHPHDENQGLKIMEHSYLKNDMVMRIENLLSKDEKWYKDKIVWAGDYMDEGVYINTREDNLHGYAYDNYSKISPPEINPNIKVFRYLINHTKKEYIDKSKIPNENNIHPLPILTAEGNGRGGGDYHGTNMSQVGVWSGNEISTCNELPDEILCSYKEKYTIFSERL